MPANAFATVPQGSADVAQVRNRAVTPQARVNEDSCILYIGWTTSTDARSIRELAKHGQSSTGRRPGDRWPMSPEG